MLGIRRTTKGLDGILKFSLQFTVALNVCVHHAYNVGMSKPLHFRATEVDLKRLTELATKLGTTITAVIREAIRLLHKKEIK